MNKPEENLNELMREYSTTVFKLEEVCQQLNTEIDKLTAMRDNIKKPYVDILIDIETKMRLLIFDRKASFFCAYGKINYRKGATRGSWDSDALDNICDADVYVKTLIWPHRKVTTSEPSIQIKLGDSV